MFTALFATVLQGFGNIFWKKSLGYGVGNRIHDLLSYIYGFIIIFYFVYTGIEGSFDLTLILFTVIILIVSIGRSGLNQKIYKEEKISSIIPYTNVNKILTIILSFFIFADVSLISLIITFIAGFVIIYFSIDFKKFSLPKKIKLILFIQFTISLTDLGASWLIFNYSEINYFIIYVICGAIFLFLLSMFLGQMKTLKGQPKSFWISRYIGGIGWIGWFLSLTIIKNLGLSITILLSFLGIGITLILSYLFLGDKPSRKDLIVTLIVTILVGIGFLYK